MTLLKGDEEMAGAGRALSYIRSACGAPVPRQSVS
jgi:hypothetical protein